MTVEKKLAFYLGRRDELPNIKLAQKISSAMDLEAIDELISLLSCKDKNIVSDSIKVLGEIGKLNPSLIIAHVKIFLGLLKDKNNRLHWGPWLRSMKYAPVTPR